MDLAVNEEFTRMYSEDELMGARRIQVQKNKTGSWFRHTYTCVVSFRDGRMQGEDRPLEETRGPAMMV